MIREPSDNIGVEIMDRKTGKCSMSQVFKAPKPGMVTSWDLRINNGDFVIRLDWPIKPEPIMLASRDFVLGWKHFLSKICWEQSNLDAEAVQFMNEVPGKIEAGLDDAEKNTAACGRF